MLRSMGQLVLRGMLLFVGLVASAACVAGFVTVLLAEQCGGANRLQLMGEAGFVSAVLGLSAASASAALVLKSGLSAVGINVAKEIRKSHWWMVCRRYARCALCCLLALLLCLSLPGMSLSAWADEVAEDTAEAPLDMAESDFGETPDDAARESCMSDASEGGSGQSEIDSSEEGESDHRSEKADERHDASSTDEGVRLRSSEPVDNSPMSEAIEDVEVKAEIEPVAPVGYYEEPEAEGRLVAVEDDQTVYRLSDTRLRVTVGGVATAFEDENGEARPIDNTLVRSDEGAFEAGDGSAPLLDAARPKTYEPRANGFDATFPERMAAGRGIVLEKEGHRVELIPEEGDFTHAAIEGNAIRFTEVRPGVDYQYTLVGAMVKEDIVLTRPVEPFVPSTRLKLSEGLEAIERDGLIVVRKKGASDSDDGSGVVLTLTAPMATDAAEAIDNTLTLTLDRASDGTPVVRVRADWDWLSAPNRAFPIRIDPTIDLSKKRLRVTAVEQHAPDTYIGENNFHGAGYDDGIKTGSAALRGGEGLGMLRLYVDVNYDFAAKIKDDWRIDKATLQLHQRTAYSKGKTKFGLYRNKKTWDFDTVTWNKQKKMSHELVQFKAAKKSAGYITWNIREAVNNWGNGLWKQYGFCVKASDERNMQCEIFDNRSSDNPPQLVIEYSKVPTEVDNGISLDGTTINVRTVTETDASGKLRLDGVFTDGLAKSGAMVAYELTPSKAKGVASAGTTYQFPNSSGWESAYPKGTRYRDKLSNWQSPLFGSLTPNVKYQVTAVASHEGTSGKTAKSDTFVVYKATALDTLPSIAKHYGVSLNTLAKDNRVQDTLVVGGNTLFIRNPKTTKPYRTKNLTDTQKKRIDAALMGRDKHCEYGFEPINLNTGNFILEASDATVPEIEGDFSLVRTYNAQGEGELSPFGRNWSFPWDESLGMQENGAVVYAAGDGKIFWFDSDGAGGFRTHADTGMTLRRIAYDEGDDTFYRWEIAALDGSVRRFDKWGRLTNAISPKGLATRIERDGAGNVSAVVSPTGVRYQFACNGEGLITGVSLPGGVKLAYGYDAQGNLTSHRDANGNVVRYEYDAQGRMTAWYDQNGKRVVRNTYDAQGRVVRQLDMAGRANTISYAVGSTRATDAAGRTTTYRHDGQGRTVGITYPDGITVSRTYGAGNTLTSDEHGTYAYDAHGNLVRSTALDGQVTRWTYDGSNRVTSRTDPDGATTTYAYDGKGNMLRTTSPSRGTTTYTYDGQGRCLSESDADGVGAVYAWTGSCLTAVTTALGTTRYSYDAMGRCTAVTDPAGHVSRTFYDAAGRQTGEQDGAGATTTYALDRTGFMTAITDPGGAVTKFTYDGAYNITSMTDPVGGVTRYEYDAAGNKTAQIDPNGARWAWVYNSRDRVVSATDALGATTRYSYDERGNVVSIENALGAKETAEYDKTYGLATRTTDARGNATTYSYDAAGRVTREELANGVVRTSAYLPGGQLASEVDERGATTTYGYTAAGRLSFVNAEGRIWGFSYDGAGKLSDATDPSGRHYFFSYDKSGNLAAVADDEGTLGAWSYDGEGRIVRETDSLGVAERYAYDACGNLVRQVHANGSATTYDYDALGSVVAVTDPRGYTTRYAYDGAGNLAAVADAEGHVRTAQWDAAGNLVWEKDTLGHVTAYEHDAAGRVTARVLPDGARESYAYDMAGNLVRVVDAFGLETTFEWDVAGNAVSAEDNTGVRETYEYDGGGNLTAAVDALGRRASWEYDSWGAVVSEMGADGATTTYERDEAGRITRVIDALEQATAYDYDARGNLVKEIREADGAVTDCKYDAAGRMTMLKDALGSVSYWTYDESGNVVTETDPEGNATAYEYDDAGNVSAFTDPLGNRATYEWDAAGNLTAFVTPEGSRDTYEYDGEGRPVAHTDPLGRQERWGWDAMGNLASHTDFAGALTTYSYDAHGNLICEADALGNETYYETDLRGNVTACVRPSGARWEYTWDVLDRLVKVRTPRGYECELSYNEAGDVVGETDNMGARSTYAYDKLHRMVEAFDGAAMTQRSATLGVSRSWEYDAAGNLVAETDGTGAKTSYEYDAVGNLVACAEANGTESWWTWDKNGNPLAQGGAGALPHMWLWDAAGNLSAESDGRGNVTGYHYDGDGRLVRREEATGAVAAYRWDKAGNLAAVSDAIGNTSHWEYDAMGRVAAEVDRRGARTEYRYDALGRLTQVTEPSGAATTYAYDCDGNLTNMTDALGRIASYTYDAEGDLLSVASPSGAQEKFVRDPIGQITVATDAAGKTTRYNWDELGNLVEKGYDDANEQPVVYAYDAEGRVLSRSDGTGEALFERDDLGRIIAETDGAGKRIGYAYDDAGNLARVDYPDGSQVSYAYDKEGNLIEVRAPEGVYAYIYDAANRPIALDRPDGSGTTYVYDQEGRLTCLTHKEAAGATVSSFEYTYDEEGNPIVEEAMVTQSDGTARKSRRTFAYNSDGKLVSFTEIAHNGSPTVPTRVEETYEWDAAGNRVALERRGDSDERILFQYDEDNRLVSSESSIGGGTAYAYDAAGNLVCKTEENQEAVEYAWDVENRLRAVRQGGRVLMAATYDGDGNRVFQASLYHTDEIEHLALPALAVERKADVRVVSEDNAVPESDEGVCADARGSEGHKSFLTRVSDFREKTAQAPRTEMRARVAFGLAAADPLSLAVPATAQEWFAYGASVAVASAFVAINPGVGLAAMGAVLCFMLPQPDKAQGPGVALPIPVGAGAALTAAGLAPDEILSMAAGASVLPLEGDARAEGNPTLKGLDAAERWHSFAASTSLEMGQTGIIPVDRPYVQDRWELVAYVNSTVIDDVPQPLMRESSVSGDLTDVYGLSRLSTAGGVARTPAFATYLEDGQGSVSAVLDSAGAVSAAYRYSPWGEASGDVGELPAYGYNGEEAAAGSGLQYLRARWYDASDGTFGSQDTYLGKTYDPSTLNRYAYAGGNPVTYADPTGHESRSTRGETKAWLDKTKTKRNSSRPTLFQRATRSVSKAHAVANSRPHRASLVRTAPKLEAAADRAVSGKRSTATGPKSVVVTGPGKAVTVKATAKTRQYVTAATSQQSRYAAATRQRQRVIEHFCSTAPTAVSAPGKRNGGEALWSYHTALEVTSFIPGVGAGSDLINAALYAGEGKWDSARDSALGAVNPAKSVTKGLSVVSGAAKVAGKVEGASSRKLRANLVKAGFKEPKYKHAAHHIVPGGSKSAQEARDHLKRLGIGINDAANGVFLPTKRGVGKGAHHPSLHTKKYITEVTRKIGKAQTKKQAEKILADIREELLDDRFEH
ncbi:DNRLRE domain-containing protein [Adlercreutzia caecimuris]|uniref:DNRLRE domain-containing protein n=1 Tax=Adlercreutzia caecimuris TaxID=671266 RepID=UPI001C3D1449|nr:DNRLRE domain-containing protein [Adlercreutzia caecimuris]MCR2037679.1 DNRLRE domain-containing protein [Adlercreutzia caecimuris]